MKGANFQLSATNRAGPAFSSFNKGLKGIRTNQARATRTNKSFMKGMSANRRIIQNVGFQVSDLGVQIAGGQSALLSLTQNVPQVVQMFGAWGAVLAGLITVIGTFAILMTKSGKGLADLAPMFGVAREEMEAFSAGLNRLKELSFDAINFVINNMDQLLITAGVVAGFFAGRWVASQIAAAFATRTFATAQMIAVVGGKRLAAQYLLTTVATNAFTVATKLLTKALMLTGIGALVVAAGYLIERLFTLKQATGSWADSFKLLGDVAKQTFAQIPTFALAMHFKIASIFPRMEAAWFETLSRMVGAMPGWVNSIVGAVVGAVQGARVAITTLGLMFNAVKSGNFAAAKNFGSRMGEFVTSAYKAALDKAYVGSGSSLADKLMGSSADAKSRADGFAKVGDALIASATNTIPAWTKLKDLMKSVDDGKDFDMRSLLGGSAKADKAADKAADERFKNKLAGMKRWYNETNALVKREAKMREAAEKAADKAANDRFKNALGNLGRWHKTTATIIKKQAAAGAASLAKLKDFADTMNASIKENLKGLIKGTKSFGDAMSGILDSLADKILDFALDSLLGSFGGSGGGGLGGFFANTFSKILSFNGGGYTGNGSRSGGVDGKGGFPAILHPKESVIDHTKVSDGGVATGYGSGGGSTPVTITNVNHFNGVTREEVMRDVSQSQKQMKKQIDKELPGRINKHNFNGRRGMNYA